MRMLSQVCECCLKYENDVTDLTDVVSSPKDVVSSPKDAVLNQQILL